MSADLLNIILPIDILSSTLMSNRFYLALIHRKSMLVNEESFQASIVKQFNLGLILKSEEDIYEKLLEYINHFDFAIFNKGCCDMIEILKKDIVSYENRIKIMLRNIGN